MDLEASLIMPTRNRADILRLALPRMLDQTVPAGRYEIVVVDDASEDDTGAAIREIGAPNLVYHRQQERGAAAAARNRAIEAARGRLLLFVDDDAFVRPDYVERHLEAHSGRSNLAVSGPIVEVSEPPAEREPPAGWWLGRHMNAFPTGNVSVAREAVVRAGMFDADFQSYGWEDAEMFRRLMKVGVRRSYCWKAPIYHYKPPAARRDFIAQIGIEENRGRMGALYHAKHPDIGVAFQTKQIGALHTLERGLSRLFGIQERMEEMRRTGTEPQSGFIRFLMVNHAEMAAGRLAWQELGEERRRQLAAETRARTGAG